MKIKDLPNKDFKKLSGYFYKEAGDVFRCFLLLYGDYDIKTFYKLFKGHNPVKWKRTIKYTKKLLGA